MNTFLELNNFGALDIPFTDNRPFGVVFDKRTDSNLDKTLTISEKQITVSPIINILEIIQPNNANVEYEIALPISQATVEWDNLPAGVTQITVGNRYILQNITTPEQYQAIKDPNITIDDDFFGEFFYEVKIRYNTPQGQQTVNGTVGVFAPQSLFESSANLDCTGIHIKGLTSNLIGIFDSQIDLEKEGILTTSIISELEVNITYDLGNLNSGLTSKFSVGGKGFNGVAIKSDFDVSVEAQQFGLFNIQQILSSPDPQPPPDEDFGQSGAINNANQIVIAADAYDDAGGERSGRVYIFNSNGILENTLSNPNFSGVSENDLFGRIIDISDTFNVTDNNDITYTQYYIAVSAQDATHVYKKTIVSKNDLGNIVDSNIIDLIYSIDLSDASIFFNRVKVNNNYLVVSDLLKDYFGETEAGQVKIYDVEDGDLLHTINSPYAEKKNRRFGSLSDIDQSQIAIEARGRDFGDGYDGGIFVYNLDNGTLDYQIGGVSSNNIRSAGNISFSNNKIIAVFQRSFDTSNTSLEIYNNGVLQYDLPEPDNGKTTINQNTALIHESQSILYAYDLQSGNLIYSKPIDGGFFLDSNVSNVLLGNNDTASYLERFNTEFTLQSETTLTCIAVKN